MGKILLLKVLTLSCFVIGTTWAASLSTYPDEPLAVSCQYVEYMLGDVPNPFNCSQYFTCVHAPPGGSQLTVPIVRPCGDGLFYDFRSCQCEFSIDGCYDADLELPLKDFFTCAMPMSSGAPAQSVL